MQNRVKLLRLIADSKLYSGEELGRALGVSRAAIWKMINSLSHYGLTIVAMKGKGYRLSRSIEFLDKQLLLSRMRSPAVKILNKLEIFEEIDSTNKYLLESPEISDKHACVILAEYQTQGRGRRGNSWISPFGSGISLSIAWHFEQPVESLTCLSLAAGSAVIRVLTTMGFDGVGLKWPNDIFFQEKKLGGLLIEMKGETAGPCDVVIGLGLNFAFPLGFEGNIEQHWTDLLSIKDPTPSRNHIAAELVSAVMLLLDSYANICTEDIINEWQQYDCMRGKKAKLKLQGKNIHGLIMGIDNDGSLLMSVDNRIQKYTAGEISLRMES
ncbi:MAG: bifunctional biotin--[acetyl-CoA-carboxylase] ligase/biotin operon repressor BirA [Gammaproteobacteria bacterium]|nr:MAG: bifunctional biotin--[acetyl-CoA-carboxylase] ligase/biotin operon repressor BirA [Gammaproteobacteria bacterium]